MRGRLTAGPDGFADRVSKNCGALLMRDDVAERPDSCPGVGMQPMLTHTPPSLSRSITAVLSPSWAARIAQT